MQFGFLPWDREWSESPHTGLFISEAQRRPNHVVPTAGSALAIGAFRIPTRKEEYAVKYKRLQGQETACHFVSRQQCLVVSSLARAAI